MRDYAPLFPPPPQTFRPVRYTYLAEPDNYLDDRDRERFAEARAEETDWETSHGPADPVTAALRRELRRYRYKPAVQLRIEPSGDPRAYREPTFGDWMRGPMLVVVMEVLDSRAPDPAELPWSQRPVKPAMVKVQSRHEVPEPIWSEFVDWSALERRNYFRAFLRATLRDLEDHELDEWFRCDGQLVDDPHKPKSSPKPKTPPTPPPLEMP